MSEHHYLDDIFTKDLRNDTFLRCPKCQIIMRRIRCQVCNAVIWYCLRCGEYTDRKDSQEVV